VGIIFLLNNIVKLPTIDNKNNWMPYKFIGKTSEDYIYYIDLSSSYVVKYKGVYFSSFRPYDVSELNNETRTV